MINGRKYEKNIGVAKTRNEGLKEAKGQYIAFLDSDDIWKNNKLKKQLDFMKKNKISFSYSGYDQINENGDYIKTIIPSKLKLDYSEALKGNQIACLTVILDRKEIKKIEMPIIKHEDYATWLNILKEGNIAKGVSESLCEYRKVDGSVSSNKFKALVWVWNIFRENQNISRIKSSIYLWNHATQAIKKHM